MRKHLALPLSVLTLMFLLASPAGATGVSLNGQATQGGVLFGMAEPGAKVVLDGVTVEVAADGRFVIGFGREAKDTAMLTVRHPGGAAEEIKLEIAPRQFQIQRIEGLPQAMVTPPPEILARIRADRVLVDRARATDLHEPMFESGFAWPVLGIITGVYGSQRILNGEPRAPHMGVDIAGPVGTPVAAPADGIVTLAERDLYLTGGTLIIDHGLGLSSVFLHLSAIEVKPGQRVHRGEPVGRMGATGRVTGPHLHWGMNWYRVRLDPALVVPPMPATHTAVGK